MTMGGGTTSRSSWHTSSTHSQPARRFSTRFWAGSADTDNERKAKQLARLVLSLDGQVMAEYNMNKERYTIGRLPDNDIRIDNAAVSGHHSLIINILNDSFLEDLNSTNGTYVNGKLIKKHALQHGDVITVGHHQLRFVEDDEQQDEFEKTMVIQPSARPVERGRAAVTGRRLRPSNPLQGAPRRPLGPPRAGPRNTAARRGSCRRGAPPLPPAARPPKEPPACRRAPRATRTHPPPACPSTPGR